MEFAASSGEQISDRQNLQLGHLAVMRSFIEARFHGFSFHRSCGIGERDEYSDLCFLAIKDVSHVTDHRPIHVLATLD
jgi:hypothetical protein